MRFLILISAMLIGSDLQCMAQERTIIGYVQTSCGTWTNERSRQPATLTAREMQMWAYGFLSGSNWSSDSFDPKDRLKDIDGNGISAWLDNYCRQHPLDQFSDAVATLSGELKNRAARQ
jgi:hypothetical protein